MLHFRPYKQQYHDKKPRNFKIYLYDQFISLFVVEHRAAVKKLSSVMMNSYEKLYNRVLTHVQRTRGRITELCINAGET